MLRGPQYVFSSEELFDKIRHPLAKENKPLTIALGFQSDNLLSGCVTIHQESFLPIPPCKVFRPLLRVGSDAVVVLRYEPVGEVFPLEQDYENKFGLHEAGQILEIPLLDYLLIGKTNWFSL